MGSFAAMSVPPCAQPCTQARTAVNGNLAPA
jgi:hypothetical protein